MTVVQSSRLRASSSASGPSSSPLDTLRKLDVHVTALQAGLNDITHRVTARRDSRPTLDVEPEAHRAFAEMTRIMQEHDDGGSRSDDLDWVSRRGNLRRAIEHDAEPE
ncbi:hypothetical protein HKX48_008898, partial [Thoreauomyces humboldtii]